MANSPDVDGSSLTKPSDIALDFFAAFVEFILFAAVVSWGDHYARALGAEDAEPQRGLYVITGLALSLRAIMRGNRTRASVTLHESLVEVRGTLRDAATDERNRDKRAATRDQRLYRATLALVAVAAITLVIAVIALAR
jgi:hypothetical protein